MKKSAKVKNQKLSIFLIILILIITGISIFTAFNYYSFTNSYIYQLPETPKNLITKIPNNIKQKTVKQASISATFRVPILMYHYIEYVQNPLDTIRVSLNIPPDIFEQQLKTLIAAHYTFITPSFLSEVLDGKKTLPKKPIILSFDDGYRDFYEDVLPILEKYKKYHVKAVSYVITGFLNGPNFMTTQQVKKVSKSGLVEIGAHTVHHLALASISLNMARYEITASKKYLQKLIGKKVVSFAYPYGSFDEPVIKLVEAAGFKTAVSTIPGVSVNKANRFFLYRIRPGYRTGENLLSFVSSNFTSF